MPLEIILKVAAQKEMNWNKVEVREAKILFGEGIYWHGVPSERTNNQLINIIIFS